MQAAVDDVLARIAQFEAEAATLRRENVALRHGLRLRSAKPMPPPVADAIRHAATTCAVQPEPQLWTMEAWLRSLGIDRLVAGELKRQMKRLRAVKAVDPVYVRAFLSMVSLPGCLHLHVLGRPSLTFCFIHAAFAFLPNALPLLPVSPCLR